VLVRLSGVNNYFSVNLFKSEELRLQSNSSSDFTSSPEHVVIDAYLARLYGVTTKRLNE